MIFRVLTKVVAHDSINTYRMGDDVMAIKYYSRSLTDNTHLYKYDTETHEFFYMEHCWTGVGEWVKRKGAFPPEYEIVQITEQRAKEISKGVL